MAGMNVHSTARDIDRQLDNVPPDELALALTALVPAEKGVGIARCAHAAITSRLLIALGTRLDPNRFEAYAVDIGLKTPDSGIRFPDIVVDRAGGGGGKDLAVTAPVLVWEVLSESTARTDLVEKLAEYTGIPSVQSYVVLSQDEPRAWLWSRRSDRWTGPEEIVGAGIVSLPALEIELRLGRLYPPAPLQ
jgi:Uma2 family endonuclease